MKTTTGVLAAVLMFPIIGCGKKDDKKAPESEPKVTVPETKVPEAEAPTKASPDEIAKRVHECFGYFGDRNVEGFKSCFTTDGKLEIYGGASGAGIDEILKITGAFQAGFSDLKNTNQLTLVNGTNVVSVDLLTGTNDAEFMGMPATNKKMGLLAGHVLEIDDVKRAAKHERIYMDMATMMGQLGMSPAPHRPMMEQGAASPSLIVATGSETEAKNVELTKQAYAALSAGDMEAHYGMIKDDVVCRDQSLPADLEGKKALRDMTQVWTKAFSDMKITPVNVWAAGDYVVVESSWQGKNTGALPEMGIKKATDKEINAHVLDVARIDDGKLAEMWSFMNGMEVAAQLGLMPAPEQK